MTEGRQPFTAEIKMLAKGPSTYDPLENAIRQLLPAATRKERTSTHCNPRLRFNASNAPDLYFRSRS
jgi:hypothetical protein